jgi:uncharacterized membrane protein
MGILAVGLLVTIANVPMAWVVWPVGYGLVLPLAVGYAKHRENRQTASRPARAETDDLARAKQRYVDGDIDEREFEARLEAALDEEPFQ